MTIKPIEFTHDIEKPNPSPSKKDSLKKSKYQDRYGNPNPDAKSGKKDDDDLIRRRISSDDEEYQIRIQNAAADMAERERTIAENQRMIAESKQRRVELKKMHQHQKELNIDNQTTDLPSNENIHHNKPTPPNRSASLSLKRRPIPIGIHAKQNINNESKQSPKFKPQPPGSPKEPIFSSNSINNGQAKDDSQIHINNIKFDSYSYSSYADSIDTDSSSSENNLNMPNPPNNNNSKHEQTSDLNHTSELNVSYNSGTNATNNQQSDTNENLNQALSSNTNENIEPTKALSEKYFYRMEKTTASRIPKKKKKFTFFLGNTTLIEVIYSKKEKNIQFKAFDARSQSEKLYTLLIGNQKSSFSLRNGTIYDNEIFSMRIVDEKKQFHYQSVFLNSFVNMKDFPNKLVNRHLDLDMDSPESPTIIFGKRSHDIIPSKSNWIFYSAEDEELIAVMRGSKTTIFIETIPIVIAPILFTIAFAAFIGHPDKA